MDRNRLFSAALNGLSTATLGYVVARFRGSESPRRTALVWGIVGTAVSYVVLGRIDMDEIEARAEQAAAEAAAVDDEADAETPPNRPPRPGIVGSAVEHVMGFDDGELDPDSDTEATA